MMFIVEHNLGAQGRFVGELLLLGGFQGLLQVKGGGGGGGV